MNIIDHPLYHPTWDILDSTKIKSHALCPRKYFWEHMVGWAANHTSVHLVFGSAIHKALECLRTKGFTDDIILESFNLFLEEYRKEFSIDEDERLAPKNPDTALKVIVAYSETYKRDNLTVIETEIPGRCYLAKDIIIHFKVDALAYGKDKRYYLLDYKTCSRMSQDWVDQWQTDIQMNMYNYLLQCQFTEKETGHVIVDGICVKKTKGREVELIRVPCKRTPTMVSVWYWNMMRKVDEIRLDMEDFLKCTEEQTVLTSFPMREVSCMNYGSLCPYHGFCSDWANPLVLLDEIPDGFKEKRWDPRKREEGKTVVKVGVVNEEKEDE